MQPIGIETERPGENLVRTDVRLNVARFLLIAGLGVGLLSWRESIGHIGDADFLMPGNPSGSTHGWYHVFREVCGDLAKMVVFLLVFFGPARWRTPVTFGIGLILMVGYYAPLWVGEPFLADLSTRNVTAGVIHVAMTTLTFAALGVARPSFRSAKQMAR